MAISSEAVRRATGKGLSAWFERLDGQDATGHAAFVRCLREDGVSAWWSQSIAVAYEQAQGLRVEGQTGKGDFQASVERTLQTVLTTPWLGATAVWKEGVTFPDTEGARVTVRTLRPGSRLRFWRAVPDRRIVEVGLAAHGDRSILRFMESGMASLEERETSKARWRRALDHLEGVLG